MQAQGLAKRGAGEGVDMAECFTDRERALMEENAKLRADNKALRLTMSEQLRRLQDATRWARAWKRAARLQRQYGLEAMGIVVRLTMRYGVRREAEAGQEGEG